MFSLLYICIYIVYIYIVCCHEYIKCVYWELHAFFSPKQLNYIIKNGDLQVLSAKQTGSKVDW